VTRRWLFHLGRPDFPEHPSWGEYFSDYCGQSIDDQLLENWSLESLDELDEPVRDDLWDSYIDAYHAPTALAFDRLQELRLGVEDRPDGRAWMAAGHRLSRRGSTRATARCSSARETWSRPRSCRRVSTSLRPASRSFRSRSTRGDRPSDHDRCPHRARRERALASGDRGHVEPQRTLLSRSLDRILASHGETIDTITDDEIIGTYERVAFDLLPDAFVEAFIAAAAKRRRVG
jgi:hypothetical protein